MIQQDAPKLKILSKALALLEAIAAADRARLAIESVALRQLLNVLRPSVFRANFSDNDRTFWVLLCSLFENWNDHLVIVKPETVFAWRRKGFAYHWKRKACVLGQLRWIHSLFGGRDLTDVM
ncbi:MAG: hypothetical protein V3W41_09115 [Planctomycetota bacterium]